MRKTVVVLVSAVLMIFGAAPAQAESDPFPGVEYQQEIPGTRISSPAGYTQAQWEETETYRAFSCPAHSGNAISVDVSNKIWSNYCIKLWQPQAVVDAWKEYYQALDQAQKLAEERSLDWNKANPGEQKCFQWGPLVDPNGGESSGGVCANPVSADYISSEDANRQNTFESTASANRVSAFLTSVRSLPVTTTKKQISLPKLRAAKKLGLTLKVVSRQPEVCSISGKRIIFLTSGRCDLRIRIVDAAGNKVVSKLSIQRA